ncbi:basement membrane-specific heparan sulfate proteoglycan core protein-like [Chanos chanos]|uniref:Basement membrane-specific heparan sulfate proteoglycan core protein-like n=1 Tax=Chanos chanos TaxID=29144 RepID=A0A6J2VTZ1_CHACN|nr:basement membrane-specific heparan sulfate proteoglycan core protein-like [Chanos chanos]
MGRTCQLHTDRTLAARPGIEPETFLLLFRKKLLMMGRGKELSQDLCNEIVEQHSNGTGYQQITNPQMHVGARLKFAAEHVEKPVDYWENVVWLDETKKIELFGNDVTRHVWRRNPRRLKTGDGIKKRRDKEEAGQRRDGTMKRRDKEEAGQRRGGTKELVNEELKECGGVTPPVSRSGRRNWMCKLTTTSWYSPMLGSLFYYGQTQEKLKPSLTLRPQRIFSGESVTLRCEIPGGNISYVDWYKDQDAKPDYRTDNNQYVISPVKTSHSGTYTCAAHLYNSNSTDWSDGVTLSVTALPRATLTVKPETTVYTGETVSLKCEIETESGWRYKWYKGSTQTELSSSVRHTVSGDTLTIRGAVEFDAGQYWCEGKRDNRPTSSKLSSPVTVTVKESPKAVVILQPDKQTFRGETVTLRCQIQGERDTDWEYSWYKKSSSLSPVSKDQEYTISPVSESHSGEYTCRGKRRRDSQNSEMSDAVTLTVSSGEFLSPPASLIISPSRTQHFTSDSLSLNCEVQSNSTGWTVRRYTDNGEVSDCSSDWGSVTGSTCSISSLQSSDSGVYWCQSDSGGNSNPLNITVTSSDVILESPVHPVTEGHTLTLRCTYRYKPADFTADFFKDGLVLQNQTTGEMTIPTVSKSDEGLYWCKHQGRRESPKSWITVRNRVKGSSSGSISVAESQNDSSQTSSQDPNSARGSGTQPEHLPQKSGDAGIYYNIGASKDRNKDDVEEGPDDVTYSEIVMKNMKFKNKGPSGQD